MRDNTSRFPGSYTKDAWNRDGALVLHQNIDGDRSYRSFYCTRGTASRDPTAKKAPTDYSYGYNLTYDANFTQIQSVYQPDYGTSVQIIGSNIVDGLPWNQSTAGSFYADWPDYQAQIDRLLSKIFDNLALGKGNLIVDFAERRDTIRMIRNCLSVRKLAKTFMRELVFPKHVNSHSKRLKYVSDKWLEYRYGWMPLVSSTYESLKTLSRDVDSATIKPLKSRTAWTKDWIQRSTVNGTWVGHRQTISGTSVRKSEIGGWFSTPRTKSIYDFTSLNPLGIAWELLPFSFVADWFVTVGQTMELWENYIKFASNFHGGYMTKTSYEDARFLRTFAASSPPLLYPNGSQVGGGYATQLEVIRIRHKSCSKARELLVSLPRPGGPRVDVKLNSKRLLDASALLRSVLVGNPKLNVR